MLSKRGSEAAMPDISREQSTVGGTASDSPVMQGRNARENGHGRDNCPYPEGSVERQGWLEGYDNVTADHLEGRTGVGETAVSSSDKKPTHRHECLECVYLGTTGPTEAFKEYATIDHYWCPQGNVGLPTLIQRYGSGAHQYLAIPVKVCHPQHGRLRQTYAMAQRNGLIPPEG